MRKRIHHLVRKYPVRSRMLFGTIAIFLVLSAVESFLFLFAYPKTMIGSFHTGGLTRTQTEERIRSVTEQPFPVVIGERTYEFRYRDMGLTLHMDEMVRQTFLPNAMYFPKNVFLFLRTLLYGRSVTVSIAETPDFDRFISRMIVEKKNGGDEILFDPETKKLSYLDKDSKQMIDKNHLLYLLKNSFGSTKSITPHLIDIPKPQKTTIELINNRLTNVYSTPLEIHVTGLTTDTTKILTPEELKRIITFSMSQETQEPIFDCSTDMLLSALSISKSAHISPHTAKTTVLDAANARYRGVTINDITIPSGNGPKTDGTFAPKYAEIDISTQRMYTFSNGELQKEYRVSTGLYYPTPTGTFKILNKAPNAFSTIYNVWMPWWMAFGYSNELNAYFGIHELPYWLSPDGEKKQRPRERIGTPSTGGCVALDIGEAEEFYAWADIGMPIVINK